MARWHNDDSHEVHFKQGSCSIILKQGDLLDEKDVDVIVIPTPGPSELNPESFVLYKSFCSKVDENFKREIKKLRSELTQQNPQIISKNGHGYIFAIPPFLGNSTRAYEYLKKTYTLCLNVAVKNDCRKIAFPTIGCGVSGFEAVDAVRSVYQTLEHFGQSKDGKKMNEIRIIVYDSRVWKDFTDIFMEMSDAKSSNIKFNNMYELLYSIPRLLHCFDLDSCFLNHSKPHLNLIRILDYQEIQTHWRCHQQKIQDKYHDNSHNARNQPSND